MRNNIEQPHLLSPLMTVEDVARFLGVHEKTIYDWAARGWLPCVRVGSRLRFDPRDVNRWVSARKEG
jgi:excisionase family DNA binding protein